MTGRVLWFNKRYGYIKGLDKIEYYFHWTDIEARDGFKFVYPHDNVEFEIIQTEKSQKPKATKITVKPDKSQNGKCFIRITCFKFSEQLNIEIEALKSLVYTEHTLGVRFVSIVNNFFICTNKKINGKELKYIYNYIKTKKDYESIRNTFLYTKEELDYDLIFV